MQKEAPIKKLYSQIVEAMKKKDTGLVYKLYERYIEIIDNVKPDLFAFLFHSLEKREDEVYLRKWLEYVDKQHISLPENAYTCLFECVD